MDAAQEKEGPPSSSPCIPASRPNHQLVDRPERTFNILAAFWLVNRQTQRVATTTSQDLGNSSLNRVIFLTILHSDFHNDAGSKNGHQYFDHKQNKKEVSTRKENTQLSIFTKKMQATHNKKRGSKPITGNTV